MKIDTSEVKSLRDCRRKWAFSSRNMWHLRSKSPSSALSFGTLFHECLANLYLGGPLDKVLNMALKELSNPPECRTMESMLSGYYKEVLHKDLAEYRVLDIEHHFEMIIEPFASNGITLCGSIDMICETPEHVIWGFEHKSCGKFRDPLYTKIDEQPRLYTVALLQYVAQKNEEWESAYQEAGPYTLGGIFINEVRKVQRTFDHKRTPCVYNALDLENFLKGFEISCCIIKDLADEGAIPLPEPGYLKCNMCEFKDMCDSYRYTEPILEDILDEFSEEFKVREFDHLEEKTERKVDASSGEVITT